MLGSPQPALGNAVSGDNESEPDTETLARQTIASAAGGSAPDTLVGLLVQHQNQDGGFGGAAGHGSHALDTSWAVVALAKAGRASSPEAVAARAWLVAQVDGTSGIKPTPGLRALPASARLYATSLATIGLQTGTLAAERQAALQLTNWLKSQQGADGGWSSDPLVSSWVILALLGSEANSAELTAARAFLEARQVADGSWGGDPYVTALAVRALAGRPASGTSASAGISGTVVDAQSGLALANCAIAVFADSGAQLAPSSVNDALGRFALTGLPSGALSVRVSRVGYESLSLPMALGPGTSANLGTVRLAAQAGTGIVSGTVRESPGGVSLSGVSISVTAGGLTSRAATDSAGRFEVVGVVPGAVTLSAARSGYQPVTAVGTVGAAQTLNFSPGMAKLGVGIGSNVALSGRFVNAGNGTALAGVRVDVVAAGGAVAPTVLTSGADGRFATSLIPGAYALQFTAQGFSGGSLQLVTTAGSALDLGNIPLSALLAAARIVGKVSDDAGRPKAGARLDLHTFGQGLRTATTGPDGRYAFESVDLGTARLRASAAGYITREAAVAISSAIEYPQDFTLPSVAAAGIDVRITALTPDAPTIAAGAVAGFGASVSNQATAAQTVRVELDLIDAEGSLVGAGSAINASGQGQSEFLVPAAGTLALRLQWNSGSSSPGTYLARLRVADASSLTLLAETTASLGVTPGVALPDLAIASVARSSARSDPQSLSVEGSIAVDLVNRGAAATNQVASMVAYVDVNRNGRWDSAADLPLGRWRGALSLGAGASRQVSIPLAGTLPFRDAPVSVMADADGEVAESDENNNGGSTANGSRTFPTAAAFNPVLKWHWTGATSSFPDYNQVMMAPVVGRVLDTNGDGAVNALDAPVVAFVSFNKGGATWTADGIIRIVAGATGQELLAIRDATYPVSALSGLTLADLDADGKPEIVACTQDYRLIVFRNDGTRKWVTAPLAANPGTAPWGAGILVADLDGDGQPEVVWQKSVFDINGNRKWTASGPYIGSTLTGDPRFAGPIAADLFQQNVQNLILGASVYGPTGALLWQAQDGFTAVADFDRDGSPEIVVVRDGTVSLYRSNGTRIWQTAIPGGGYGGPPTVADVDGDGIPEIGVAGGSRYSVYRANGTVLWSKPTQDQSSQMTGSTVFDFDGDGSAEVLYADETNIWAYNGRDGTVLWRLPHSQGTAIEYPVVADIDTDGHADLITVSTNYGAVPNATVSVQGVRVFRDVNNAWVNVRSVWNQHAYSITNVNDDLTIPARPTPSWKAHNTFRLNSTVGFDPTAVPDLTAGFLRLVRATDGRTVVRVRVGNAGARPVAVGAKLALYGVSAGNQANLLAAVNLPMSLATGEWADIDLPPQTLAGAAKVAAVIDDDGAGHSALDDFDRSNNRVELDLTGFPLGLVIAAGTDRLQYGADAAVIVSAPVSNRGAAAVPDARVSLSVLAPNGQLVAELGRFATGGIQAGTTVVVNALWNTATNPAAPGWRVRALLLDGQGRTVDVAEASFAIESGIAHAAAAQISTDRPRYQSTDVVVLSKRVTSLVANATLDSLVLQTSVRGPQGGIVMQRNEPLGTLAAGHYKALEDSLSLRDALVGSYSARLDVVDSSGATIAAASTTFEVAQTGGAVAGLAGTLSASPRTLAPGAPVTLTWTVSNSATTALQGVPAQVRIVDPLVTDPSAAVIAQWPVTLNVAAGGTQAAQQVWVAPLAQAGRALVAALVATPVSGAVTLAQDGVQVGPAAAVANVQALPAREARVLAFVQCDPFTSSSGSGSSTLSPLACAEVRAAALRQALAVAAPVSKVVTSKEEFATEMRCGLYNVFWLSGGSYGVDTQVRGDLREAVRAGQGLIVDGESSLGGAPPLADVLGIDFAWARTEIPPQNVALPAGGPFLAGQLATQTPPVPLVPTTAQVLATFSGPDTTVSGSAAIVGNQAGQGLAMAFGFDVVGLLQSPSSAAQVQALLQGALQWIAPTQETDLWPGATAATVFRVGNQASETVAVDLSIPLPSGARWLGGSDGVQPDASSNVVFTGTLAPGATRDFVVRMAFDAPATPRLDAQLRAAVGAGMAAQGGSSLEYRVMPATTWTENARAVLLAVAPPDESAGSQLSYAAQAIGQATQALTEGRPHDAWMQLMGPGWFLTWLLPQAQYRPVFAAVARAHDAAQRAVCAQAACMVGELSVQQAGQTLADLPLGTTVQILGRVQNQCTAAPGEWWATTSLVNRTTGYWSFGNWETLPNLPGFVHTWSSDWLVAGAPGDVIDGRLLLSRNGFEYLLAGLSKTVSRLTCDVDANGRVDNADLQLITAGAGNTVSPGDPRDANADGSINTADVGFCQQRCTAPNCAP